MKQKKFLAALLIAGVATMTALSGCGTGAKEIDHEATLSEDVAEYAAVPDVNGMTEEAAVAAIEEAGLNAYVLYIETSDAEPGVVYDFSPVAGTMMAQKATVTITINQADDESETEETTDESTGEEGDGQSSAETEEAAEGEVVLAKVPSLIGYTEDAISEWADISDFEVSYVYAVSSVENNGLCIEQSVEEGTAPAGSNIVCTIGTVESTLEGSGVEISGGSQTQTDANGNKYSITFDDDDDTTSSVK